MGKKYSITVDGVTHIVEVNEVAGNAQAVVQPVVSARVAAPAPAPAAPSNPAPAEAPASVGANTVTAPLQGTLQDIKVSVGQSVKAGDVLLIIEAMKMENEVAAPKDGQVAAIHQSKGAKLNAGEPLLDIN